MLVIADTSPLNYLILIDAVELLPRLYKCVVLPHAALDELKHPCVPAAVSKWANSLPPWIAATATVGVLKSAAEHGWIDLAQAFARLRQTNFRVSEELFQQSLNEHARRKEHAPGKQEGR